MLLKAAVLYITGKAHASVGHFPCLHAHACDVCRLATFWQPHLHASTLQPVTSYFCSFKSLSKWTTRKNWGLLLAQGWQLHSCNLKEPIFPFVFVTPANNIEGCKRKHAIQACNKCQMNKRQYVFIWFLNCSLHAVQDPRTIHGLSKQH